MISNSKLKPKSPAGAEPTEKPQMQKNKDSAEKLPDPDKMEKMLKDDPNLSERFPELIHVLNFINAHLAPIKLRADIKNIAEELKF
jgi:hypothetical protein